MTCVGVFGARGYDKVFAHVPFYIRSLRTDVAIPGEDLSPILAVPMQMQITHPKPSVRFSDAGIEGWNTS